MSEEGSQKIEDEEVLVADEAKRLWQTGVHLADKGKYQEAIACYDLALALTPSDAATWYYRGIALFYLGCFKEAIACYDKAIDLKPDYYEALSDRGYTLSVLGRHRSGLANCDRALPINPDYYKVWCHRGYILKRLNRNQEALSSCNKALELQPDSHEALTNRGFVLALLRRYQEAVADFDKALEFNSNYQKAWYNRGIALVNLGRKEAALSSFQKALEIKRDCQEFWYPQAWYAYGYMLMWLGRYEEAIASFAQALVIKPDSPAAAFYQLILLILTGRIVGEIGHPIKRSTIFHNIQVIFDRIKYLLLGILAVILVNHYSPGIWIHPIKESFSMLFSLALIGLFIGELWKNRANLWFVWKIYFQSGVLAYIRSLGIVIVTLITFAVTTPIVPSFMQWGWANAVFGNSGNIIFQPFNTIQNTNPSPAEKEIINSIQIVEKVKSFDAITAVNPNTPQKQPFNYAIILIIMVWLLLILLVPFWARLEEKIFRQGANSWRQITRRSIVFGLVHILVGIPIFAGFVLIVPGFLFACRYKYVHDLWWKETGNEKIAQELGVEASTADHAIYNAILITLFVAMMLSTN